MVFRGLPWSPMAVSRAFSMAFRVFFCGLQWFSVIFRDLAWSRCLPWFSAVFVVFSRGCPLFPQSSVAVSRGFPWCFAVCVGDLPLFSMVFSCFRFAPLVLPLGVPPLALQGLCCSIWSPTKLNNKIFLFNLVADQIEQPNVVQFGRRPN